MPDTPRYTSLPAECAPIYDKLAAHASLRPISFHVPGHKYGVHCHDSLLETAMRIDATELPDFDDLHQPSGMIADAEALAAECFGAEHTFFLVNGSTVGNLAIITSICQPGDLVLVQRNVHKSVLHGLMLAYARAVFLPPTYQEDGIPRGVASETVEEALRQYPDAKALLLTNPNYYGMTDPLEPIARLVHERGIPLVVDEAHGAHFGFHPRLPRSALSQGADAVVQSTHKMLSSMTMTAMLHTQGDRISHTRIRQRLATLQSSSPSYVLMASLDLARRDMHTDGQGVVERALQAADQLCLRLRTNARFEAVTWEDPLKIAIRDREGKLSGHDLLHKLQQYGCYPEMADELQALLVLGPGSRPEHSERLALALHAISAEAASHHPLTRARLDDSLMPLPMNGEPIEFHPGMADYEPGEVEAVPAAHSEGRRSVGYVIPYPPGIPLLMPGERISQTAAQYLVRRLEQGGAVQGVHLPSGAIYVKKEKN